MNRVTGMGAVHVTQRAVQGTEIKSPSPSPSWPTLSFQGGTVDHLMNRCTFNGAYAQYFQGYAWLHYNRNWRLEIKTIEEDAARYASARHHLCSQIVTSLHGKADVTPDRLKDMRRFIRKNHGSMYTTRSFNRFFHDSVDRIQDSPSPGVLDTSKFSRWNDHDEHT